MPLTLKPATGSGQMTLISVAGTTTNDTLTLPAKTGNIITSADSGTVTAAMIASLPVGSVIKVVSATYASSTSSATNTYVDTGLTASITPSSATNKILVLVNLAGIAKTDSNTYMGTKLLRGSTDLAILSVFAANSSSTSNIGTGTISTSYLDSPATTSSTTYKVQFRSGANTSQVIVQDGSSVSTIVLMEIVA